MKTKDLNPEILTEFIARTKRELSAFDKKIRDTQQARSALDIAIGRKMKQFREDKRSSHRSEYSIRSVAKRMGVSHVYLNDLEHGRRRWSNHHLDSFVAALGIK